MSEKDKQQNTMNFPQGRVLEIASSSDPESVLNLGSSNTCPKNGHNHHADFINVNDFGLDHLPEEIRHPAMLDYIKAAVPLTVRIVVKWTSAERPDDDPCVKDRGTRRSRMATGSCKCSAPIDSFKRKLCTVPDCHRKSDLGQEHYVYEGDVFIYTNKHVVFDDGEMVKTVIEFFYDSDDKTKVVKEYGLHFRYTKFSSDRTFFIMTIHDESFLRKVISLTKTYSSTIHSIPVPVLKNLSSYIIIISHPHGMPKKVSIGKVIKKALENVTPETVENAKRFGHMYFKWVSQLKAINEAHRQPQVCEATKTVVDLRGGNQAGDRGQNCDVSKTDSGRLRVIDGESGQNQNTSDSISELTGSRAVTNNNDGEELKPNGQKENGDMKNKRRLSNFEYTDTNVTSEPKIMKICNDEKISPEIQMKTDTIFSNPVESNVSHSNHSISCTSHTMQANDIQKKQDIEKPSGDDDNEGEVNNDGSETEKEEFMTATSFPIETIYHDAPTCQGTSGAPVIHGGFHIKGVWVPQTGGHAGYDRDIKYNYFSYNKALT